MGFFRAIRSFVAVLAMLFLLGVIAPFTLYLFVVPSIALQPKRRDTLGPRWVSWIARSLVRLCRFGGASIETEGKIDCAQPGVIIMNHQSVLEVAPLIYIMGTNRLPRFVARARYARGIPTVSRAIEYLDCVIVDPRRDRAAAVIALHNASKQGLRHSIMLFPEGHRTRDGEIQEFRPAGMVALLKDKQMPVWTIVGDGFWKLRTVMDSFFGLGSVNGRLRLVECVLSPKNPEDLPAFIEARRQNMIQELAKMRAETAH